MGPGASPCFDTIYHTLRDCWYGELQGNGAGGDCELVTGRSMGAEWTGKSCGVAPAGWTGVPKLSVDVLGVASFCWFRYFTKFDVRKNLIYDNQTVKVENVDISLKLFAAVICYFIAINADVFQ